MKPVKEMSTLNHSLMLVIVTFVLVEAKVPMTYTVDGVDSRPVTSHQNLTTCSGVPVELSVCVPTARPGSLLSLKVKGQTMSSSQTCVRVSEKFSSSQAVAFSYDEEEFIFNMKVAPCISRKSRSSTGSNSSGATPPLHDYIFYSKCGGRHPKTLDNNNGRFPGLEVLCDTATDGGDWIMIQRRTVGDLDFYRDWGSYVAGFGEVTGDHWLGLQHIHTLCPPSRPCHLRVDLKDPEYLQGRLVWAEYTFSLTGSSDNYRLSISDYDTRSTAGDALTYHNGRAFSTKDRDNDDDDYGNCATQNHGAWWYRYCLKSNLNGKYGDTGLAWLNSNNGTWLYATYSEMKVRVQV